MANEWIDKLWKEWETGITRVEDGKVVSRLFRKDTFLDLCNRIAAAKGRACFRELASLHPYISDEGWELEKPAIETAEITEEDLDET